MNKFDQDELLADVAKSLREISASLAELNDGLATMRRRAVAMGHPPIGAIRYMSGIWPRRDGDTYGIIQRQPPIQEPSPEPEVHADDKTGHL